MTASHIVSIFVCILIGWGLYRRHDRVAHRKIMVGAFVIDLGLVLWIEVSRHAVEQSFAMGAYKPPGPLLSFHIVVSILALILYIVQIFIGSRFFAGHAEMRVKHRVCGITFVILRLTNLMTSFLITS